MGYIGVSLDVITDIKLTPDEIVTCSIEIKTRVAKKIIEKALHAFELYGGDIFCKHGDAAFCKYDPSKVVFCYCIRQEYLGHRMVSIFHQSLK